MLDRINELKDEVQVLKLKEEKLEIKVKSNVIVFRKTENLHIEDKVTRFANSMRKYGINHMRIGNRDTIQELECANKTLIKEKELYQNIHHQLMKIMDDKDSDNNDRNSFMMKKSK